MQSVALFVNLSIYPSLHLSMRIHPAPFLVRRARRYRLVEDFDLHGRGGVGPVVPDVLASVFVVGEGVGGGDG